MIIGMEKISKKLSDLSAQDLVEPTQKAIALVQGTAKRNVQVDSGELRESIYTDVYQHGDKTIGVCFTNKEYAPYVEFGTGPRGQAEHTGISPEVNVAYTQRPWWIHESQVDKETAEKYHWFHIDTPQGRFYQCSGQPARPYLYPALKSNTEKIQKIFEKHIKELIGSNAK